MTYRNNPFERKMHVLLALCAIIGISLSSCMKDLLETSPYDSVASSTMWTTDNLTDMGITGIYSNLRQGFNTSANTSTGRQLYSFDRWGVTGQGRDIDAFCSGTQTHANSIFSGIWQDMYEGVRRANDAITNIPAKSPSAEEKKARYVAEAKFMRAYFYFRLNQVFKGVPVYLEPVELSEMTRARETEAEVWNVIINDLTDCINEPNLPDKYAAGNVNYGHATKGAAYALRGKAYLYMKEWDKAIADFSKVKDCGHSLFQGGYKQLFKEANEQCDEMIFSIQCVGQNEYGSDSQMYCGSRSSYGSCWNSYLISPTLVDMYENVDGSSFNWNDIIPGYNAMSMTKRKVYFLRDGLTATEYETLEKEGLDMSLYLNDGNEARIKQAYANRDPRLEASVITPYAQYIGVVNNMSTPVVSRFPHRNSQAPVYDLQTDTRSFFYYLHRKFVYEGTDETLNRLYGPIDFPIIRYADVLLMWAEALAEKSSGVDQTAIALVNEVRSRAGVGLLNSSAATTVTSKENLIERIRKERRLEFPNEGINYFDEIRWKTWKEMVFFEGGGIRQVWGGVVTPYTWLDERVYTWAIPATERERNSNLTQNDGWGD